MAENAKQKNLNSYTCDICNTRLKTKTSLRYHLFTHNPGSGSFICDIGECQRCFKNPKRLSDHKRRYHLKRESFICEYCGYHTRIKCNLTVHRRRHTGEKPYCCEYCALSFPSAYQLNTHKDIHNADSDYYCIVCGEQFVDRRTLGHHKTLHNVEKIFKCEICDKTYQQSAGLSRHRRTIHREQQNQSVEIKK